MKSKSEIAAEILKLKDLHPRVPALSGFGDDNSESILAQVKVLEDEMDEDDIDDEWGDQYVNISARDARDWMHGDRDDAPSTGWEPLAQ